MYHGSVDCHTKARITPRCSFVELFVSIANREPSDGAEPIIMRGGSGKEHPSGVGECAVGGDGGDDKGVLGTRIQTFDGVAVFGAADFDEVEGFQPVAGGLRGLHFADVGPADAVADGGGVWRPADDDFAGVGAVAGGYVGRGSGIRLGKRGGGGDLAR